MIRVLHMKSCSPLFNEFSYYNKLLLLILWDPTQLFGLLIGGNPAFDHLIINLFSLYVLFPSSDRVMFSREFAFCLSCYVPFVSGGPLNLLKSVIIHWLRNERSEKRFSFTRLGVWVQVCRGSLCHLTFQNSVVFVAILIGYGLTCPA